MRESLPGLLYALCGKVAADAVNWLDRCSRLRAAAITGTGRHRQFQDWLPYLAAMSGVGPVFEQHVCQAEVYWCKSRVIKVLRIPVEARGL